MLLIRVDVTLTDQRAGHAARPALKTESALLPVTGAHQVRVIVRNKKTKNRFCLPLVRKCASNRRDWPKIRGRAQKALSA